MFQFKAPGPPAHSGRWVWFTSWKVWLISWVVWFTSWVGLVYFLGCCVVLLGVFWFSSWGCTFRIGVSVKNQPKINMKSIDVFKCIFFRALGRLLMPSQVSIATMLYTLSIVKRRSALESSWVPLETDMETTGYPCGAATLPI